MNAFIIAALSADGYLADQEDQKSTSWTSKEDFEFFIKKTKEAGVCIMGSTTYKTIGKPLKDRLTIVYTRKKSDLPTLPLDKGELKRVVKSKSGVYVTRVKPDYLINRLSDCCNEVAILGGSQINSLFLQAGVVNTLYLTIEPILFGQGIPLFSAPHQQKLELVSTSHLSTQTLLLEYQVKQ